jgi:hypothetical protein
MKWWLISDDDYKTISKALRDALHILDTGLHRTDAIPDDYKFRLCPICRGELEHFSGLEYIPEYWFCPKCNDWAYDESGEKIARLK